MKTSPSFTFYPTDFLIGTICMSAAQVGGYIRALCYQWETGGFPVEQTHQQSVTGCDEADLLVIRAKFVVRDGVLINERMERVREERVQFANKQRINGKLGGRPKKNPGLSFGLSQTEAKKSSPSPSPSPKNTPQPPAGGEDVFAGMSESRKATFETWIKYKAERREMYKPTGLRALIKEYAAWTDAALADAAQFSMSKGYKGIFPRRDAPQTAATPDKQLRQLPLSPANA